MSMTSRTKGKRGERDWRDQLREAGFRAERGAQHRGGPGSPDVQCPDLPQLHFEVKRTERLNLRDAIEQAQRDAGAGRLAIVAHRSNRTPWLVTMPAADFFALVRESDFIRPTEAQNL